MRAAVLQDLGRIVVEEAPTPEDVGDEEVLVRVRACAVCGSDVRIFRHGNPRVTPPAIIGHEIAGEVVKVGAAVAKFEPGDRVATGADVPCGVCEWCARDMCTNCATNYALGYQFPGGFAQYLRLNATTVRYGPVHHIPEGLSFEEATLAEPLACCLNGLERAAFRPGESLVIIGAGPAGCLMADLAKALGAGRVILAQRSLKRLEVAKHSRADALVSTTEEDLRERVRQETGGEGVDIAVVACASVEAQEQAPHLLRNRGRVNFFGGLPRGSRPAHVDSNLVHYKELCLTGSHGSTPHQHRVALGLIGSGQVKVGYLITHRFPLDQVEEALRVVEEREGMKVIVAP
jgi:L-iditol 2-dehydrogenase